MTYPARVFALLVATVATVMLGAVAASADEPTTWVQEPGRSTLDTLIFFGGGTLGIYVLVVLFGLLTARNNYVPPPPSTDLVKAGDHTPAHH